MNSGAPAARRWDRSALALLDKPGSTMEGPRRQADREGLHRAARTAGVDRPPAERRLMRSGGRNRMKNGIGAQAMLAAVVLGTGVTGQASAQTQPAPPVAPTREEISPQGSTGQAAPLAPTHVRIEDQIEHAPCALAEPAYANVSVNFATVAFRNLRGVSADELASTWAEFAGHEVPVAALCEIRDRAATILRKRGFVAAVQVPPQRIEKGRRGAVRRPAGQAGRHPGARQGGASEKLIAAQLQGLVDQPYFNSFTAERTLLLAGDLPGYDIRLILRPAGGAPGEVIGDVEVQRRAIELSIGAQNYGSTAIGRYGGIAQLTFNDLLGLGDSSRISLFNTSDTREQDRPSARRGAGARQERAAARGCVRLCLDPAGHRQQPVQCADAYGNGRSHLPFIRSRRLTVRGTGGMDWIDQSLDFGAAPLSDDHLRVPVPARRDCGDRPEKHRQQYGLQRRGAQMGLLRQCRTAQGDPAALAPSADCAAAPASCTAPNLPTSRPRCRPAGHRAAHPGFVRLSSAPQMDAVARLARAGFECAPAGL